MKKFMILLMMMSMAVLFCSCDKPDSIGTDVGEFEYKQEFVTSYGSEEGGDQIAASSGNTFLLIYLKPADGTELDLDAADDYFHSGVKADVDGDTYDMLHLAYEKVNESYVRCVLIFEVADNGYSDGSKTPVVKLVLP